ncbi:helix-turn-helix transcriptional regulator [Terrabacter sp. C0L_2]|uniref:helix-turn-helix transcriptional regulator n=1 Tax=Terrabacter sp. C0L_2 TaxID=3108389 RepID=UPI002ED31165|nr:helix-turn-helix transcriptional regulator [Terrabacter sp. C0L_2]
MSQLVDDATSRASMSPAASAAAIAAELSHCVNARITAAEITGEATKGLRLLGRGVPQIMRAFTRLEPLAQRSVWGMQPTMRFDPDDPSYELDERSARRGLDLHQLISAHALTVNPLLPSLNPDVRVAPVAIGCILVDEVAAVLPGPFDPQGRPTAWLVTDPAIVDLARSAWRVTWSASTPVGDDRPPALSRRQVEVAKGLIRGVKDATLARQLNVSPRTVVADMSHLLEHLGARSRAEAVFILGGGAALKRTRDRVAVPDCSDEMGPRARGGR